MPETEQKRIFQTNLLKYLAASGKTQREVADAIGVSPQTFNTWCQGIALPRMGKVQLLADYFHINKSDLIEEKNDDESDKHYCFDEEAKKIAQEICDNPDLKALFALCRSVPTERLKIYAELISKIQNSED